MATAIIFMFLNAFLPLNFSFQAEATKYPFKLAISLEKTTFKLGEPVNITWTLTNVGEENVVLYNSRDDPPDFLIVDENFIHIFRYRSYVGVLQVIYPIARIAPGDEISIKGTWKQIYDNQFMTLPSPYYVSGYSWSPRKVPQGTYYVSGIFSSATYDVIIETPVIRITIL